MRPSDRARAEQCFAFNDAVMSYLSRAHSVDVVVLSSPFQRYLSGRLLQRSKGKIEEVAGEVATAVKAMRETVSLIRASGKRVVVVAPPPKNGTDIGRCLDRLQGHKWTLPAGVSCDIDRASFESSQEVVRRFLSEISADVPVISFDDILCDDQVCHAILDGSFIYRDGGHLSYEGSIALARGMELGTLIWESAR